MSEVPCINCITFAICNAFVKNTNNVRPLFTRKRCPLLVDFAENYPSPKSSVDARIINQVRRVYGLNPLVKKGGMES